MADRDGKAERFEIPENELKGIEEQHDDMTIPILQRMEAAKKENRKLPTCVIVVGMAGSGKTTLMAQLQRSLNPPTATVEPAETTQEEQNEKQQAAGKSDPNAENDDDDDDKEEDRETDEETKKVGYLLNVDPATMLVPYGASIDIRDTVDYKQVMKQHNLGPNGAIMTSLNLFATKFDQVINILERRAYHTEQHEPPIDYVLVDTPGQIEAFTWSASGSIMSDALASSFPTVLAFVVDTVRCASSPNTFMSNMLYACSMLYRTRLPLVIVFNKTDVVPHDFALEWMKDYEVFQDALDEMISTDESTGYYGSLTRSISLVLDEFYENLQACGVSAATGDGIDDFWSTVDKAAEEFETGYLEDLRNKLDEQKAKKKAMAKMSLQRLQRDMADSNK
mmetsp:Transcript_12160/g.16967  ORF Transcript_12160/g.16967 Transcript_12160/m.16967 type:complete len:394 (+) Transcript_12160:43-1224(+)